MDESNESGLGGDSDSFDWRSRPRTFTYDSLSRLTQAVNPESGTVSYTYDANGNVVTKTSPQPNQTGSSTTTLSYCYDALNRMTSKAYTNQSCPQSSPAATYTYDESAALGEPYEFNVGHRTSMTDAAGSEHWMYDPMGRPVVDERTTNSVTLSTTTVHNYDGSVKTLTYPSGYMITYAPNVAAQPVSAVDTAHSINYATSAAYAPHGGLWSLQNGAGIYSTYLYNSRLQSCWAYVTTGTALPISTACTGTESSAGNVLDLQFAYGSSDNGNVAGVTNNRDTTRSQTFNYDALNRIYTAYTSGNLWGETYQIDAWGNLHEVDAYSTKPQPDTLSQTPNNNNQFPNICSGTCYDAAGNVTNDGWNGYFYDAENRICSMGGSSCTTGTTYTYDGDGKRVQKSSGTLYWYGLSSDPLDETDASGDLVDEYIFFGGSRIARRDSSNNVDYYFADQLQSARVVTNSSGTILDDQDFCPYGRVCYSASSSSGNHYLFTGKERDSESGLDNFGARYNSSQYGRFMSPDDIGPGQLPEDPQTWNLYSYVRNNPLNLTDPTGQYTCGSGVSDDECKNFQTGLDTAQQSANNLKDKYGADSDQYKSAQRSIDAYGKAGVDNGVVIQVKAGQQEVGVTTVAGTTVAKTADNPTGQNISVSFKTGVLDNSNSNVLAVDEAHEGSHVADGSAWVASGFSPSLNPTLYKTEFDAFQVSARIAEGLGYGLQFPNPNGGTPYNISTTAGPSSSGINSYLRGVYNLTPSSKLAAFYRNTRVRR